MTFATIFRGLSLRIGLDAFLMIFVDFFHYFKGGSHVFSCVFHLSTLERLFGHRMMGSLEGRRTLGSQPLPRQMSRPAGHSLCQARNSGGRNSKAEQTWVC